MKKVLVALGLFAVTALAPGVVSSAQSGAATPGITWGVPRIVDPIHAYGEPDIKVAPNGDVLVSGPQGTGVQRSIWNVSKDNGDSWRVVNAVPTANSQPACTLAPALCLDLNKSSLGLGGGDTELAVSRNNTIYYDDLWALSCFTSATSSDSGATVQSSPVACSHPPADRQWLALFDPGNTPTTSPYKGTKPLVYLAYNNIVNGGNLDMSTDGLTFTPAVSGPGTYGDTSDDIYADGNLLVDQPTGDVLAVVKHTAPSPNNGLALAVGVPNADGSGQVTFHYNTITDAIGGDPALLFPVMAEDTARNLYAVWAVDTGGDLSKPQAYHVYYSFASAADGWKTSSAPRQLDSPPSM